MESEKTSEQTPYKEEERFTPEETFGLVILAADEDLNVRRILKSAEKKGHTRYNSLTMYQENGTSFEEDDLEFLHKVGLAVSKKLGKQTFFKPKRVG